MQRWLIGIIAAVLTFGGAGLFIAGPSNLFGLGSGMLRAGLVLGALALALPQVMRLAQNTPPWYLATLVVGLLVVVRWPRTFVVILPLLAVLWFLSPRRPAKSSTSQAKSRGKPRR